MVLQCFFDGGNKSDSRAYDYVTLAAVAGTFRQWKPFEKAWTRNLKKHGAEFLHTTDAAVGNSPYSRDEGWNRDRIDSFLLDCVKIAGKYIARPITEQYPFGRIGLYPYTVTINLKDYVRARNENQLVPLCADEILTMEAINACFKFGLNYAGTEYFSLLFDQNEPFRGHIIDRKRNSNFVKEFPIFSKVISEGEADARFVPALQLADLFAYCYSQKRNEKEKPRWMSKMLSHPLDEAYADYPKLVNPLVKNIEFSKSMNFPRRAATR